MLDLEPIKTRLAAASDPLNVDSDGILFTVHQIDYDEWEPVQLSEYIEGSGNRDLINHTRTDIAALIAEVERLRKENDRLKHSLNERRILRNEWWI